MPVKIRNRIEMADRLEAVMTTTYDDLTEELRLKRKHSMLKTYILESHKSEGASADQVFSAVKEAFEAPEQRKRRSVDVARTDEADLFTIHGVTRVEDFVFFIDASDRRFWIAHSISKSKISDVEVATLTSGQSRLDTAWMPIEMLESLSPLGESRGLALDFDRRYVDAPLKPRKVRRSKDRLSVSNSVARASDPPPAPISHGAHLEYVKMQLWGRGADRILNALGGASLGQSTTLSKVRLKTEDEDDDSRFSLADIKFDGKLTGRGSSFGIYSAIVGNVVRKYSAAVRQAETRFDLHWVSDETGSRMTGEPLYINLSEGLNNLERFCARIFSGAEPFRLLGVPLKRSEELYSVSAN